MILGDIYLHNAKTNPDGLALVCGEHRLTHAEFLNRAWQLANALHMRGVKPGTRVAIYSQNGLEWLETSAAAEIAGYILVSVNYRLSPPEVCRIFADTEPLVVVFDCQFAHTMREVLTHLPGSLLPICIGGPFEGGLDYETFLASGMVVEPITCPKPDDVAHIIFTSGSTGQPKGAMLTHERQYALAQNVALEGGLQAKDVHLVAMPLFHIGARCLQLGYALRGAQLVVHKKFDPEQVMIDVERHGITALQFAPVMIQMLMDSPGFDVHYFKSIRVIYYASAPMSETQLRRAIGCFGNILAQHYGMTEIGLGTVLQPHQHILDGTPEQERRLQSAGQAPTGSLIHILKEDGTKVDVGEVGEITIKNPHLMVGYWRAVDESAEVLRDGWMHTGDMGYLDEKQYLFIVDRKKDMVISGGENIYPREVEEVLLAHPAVSQAAVIGIPDPRWGEAVMACVVLKALATVEETELIDFCKARLASYKKPKSVRFLEDLPRLGNLKIDKKLLREPYWAGHTRRLN